MIGGYLRGVSYAMVGPLARRALEGVYFDIAFLGANGLSLECGATIPSLEEADTVAEVVRRARRVVIVVDHTKLGLVTHGRIADLSQIYLVITDTLADLEFLESLREHGIEVLEA